MQSCYLSSTVNSVWCAWSGKQGLDRSSSGCKNVKNFEHFGAELMPKGAYFKIVSTDAKVNFLGSLVRWRQADVRGAKHTHKHMLCKAHIRVLGCVKSFIHRPFSTIVVVFLLPFRVTQNKLLRTQVLQPVDQLHAFVFVWNSPICVDVTDVWVERKCTQRMDKSLWHLNSS